MSITCGIDWAEDHHDIALVDEQGKSSPAPGSVQMWPGTRRWSS